MASTCGDIAASAVCKAFEQLNLTGVIEVVRSHSRDQRTPGGFYLHWRSIEIARIEFSNRRSQGAMGLVEQRDIGAPRCERRVIGAREPVRAVERKRSPSRRCEPAPGDVLPVR